MKHLIILSILSLTLFAHPITVTVDCKAESIATDCDAYRINYIENIASKKATYAGQIIDENGTAVSNAPVFLYGDVWYSEEYTDSSGNFSILVTPDSDFRIKAYAESWKIWPEYNGTIPGIQSGQTRSWKSVTSINYLKNPTCVGAAKCGIDSISFATGGGGTGSATFSIPAVTKGDVYTVGFAVSGYKSGALRYAVGGYIYDDLIEGDGVYSRKYSVTYGAPKSKLYFLDGVNGADKNGFTGTISKITLTKE